MRCVRRRNEGPTRRSRFGALFVVVVLAASVPISASAQLELPELPLDEPLELGDLLNLEELLQGELPVSTDVGEVVGGTGDAVSDLLGGTPPVVRGKKPPPAPRTVPAAPQNGSWSTEGLLPSAGDPIGVVVSSDRFPAPSYGSAVGNGLSGAARRAAALAGPVAAPMLLALFAVGLLFVAARGPGRLVKVEEERKAFREQRTFRL